MKHIKKVSVQKAQIVPDITECFESLIDGITGVIKDFIDCLFDVGDDVTS
jgi:hypothetical protein